MLYVLFQAAPAEMVIEFSGELTLAFVGSKRLS